jgi:hypothetical protein
MSSDTSPDPITSSFTLPGVAETVGWGGMAAAAASRSHPLSAAPSPGIRVYGYGFCIQGIMCLNFEVLDFFAFRAQGFGA